MQRPETFNFFSEKYFSVLLNSQILFIVYLAQECWEHIVINASDLQQFLN